MCSNIWVDFKEKIATAFELVNQMPLGLQVLAIQHADKFVKDWKQANVVSSVSEAELPTEEPLSEQTVRVLVDDTADLHGTSVVSHYIKEEELTQFVDGPGSGDQVEQVEVIGELDHGGVGNADGVSVMMVTVDDGQHVVLETDTAQNKVEPVEDSSEAEAGEMVVHTGVETPEQTFSHTVDNTPSNIQKATSNSPPPPSAAGTVESVNMSSIPAQVAVAPISSLVHQPMGEAFTEPSVSSESVTDAIHIEVKQEVNEDLSTSSTESAVSKVVPRRRRLRRVREAEPSNVVWEGLNLNAADLVRQIPCEPILPPRKRGRPKRSSHETEMNTSLPATKPVKRKRGRPRKDKQVAQEPEKKDAQEGKSAMLANKHHDQDSGMEAKEPTASSSTVNSLTVSKVGASPRRSLRTPKASVRLKEAEQSGRAARKLPDHSTKGAGEKKDEKPENSLGYMNGTAVEAKDKMNSDGAAPVEKTSRKKRKMGVDIVRKSKIQQVVESVVEKKMKKDPATSRRTRSLRLDNSSQKSHDRKTGKEMAKLSPKSPVPASFGKKRISGRSVKLPKKFENFLAEESQEAGPEVRETSEQVSPSEGEQPDGEKEEEMSETPQAASDPAAESVSLVTNEDISPKDDDIDENYMPPTAVKIKEETSDTNLENASEKVAEALFKLESTISRKRGRPKGSRTQSTVCSICGHDCVKAARLKQHMLIHSDVKPYMCELCGRSFKYTQALKHHLKVHLGVKDFACTLCDYKASCKDQVLVHVRRVHTQEKPYRCEECGMGFHSTKSLWGHRAVHKEQTFRCDQCDFCTSRKGSLIQHKKNLHEEQLMSFQCQMCDRRFKHQVSFRVHLRTHTGEKPYSCRTCGTSFTSTSQRAQHERIHEERQFQCTTCLKRFVTKHQLERHMHIHTGVKSFECPFCPYKSNIETNLRKHCIHIHKVVYPPIVRPMARRSSAAKSGKTVRKVKNCSQELSHQEVSGEAAEVTDAEEVNALDIHYVNQEEVQYSSDQVETSVPGSKVTTVVGEEAEVLIEQLESSQAEAVTVASQEQGAVQQIIFTKDVNEVGQVVLSAEEYDAWDSGAGVIQVIQVVEEGETVQAAQES